MHNPEYPYVSDLSLNTRDADEATTALLPYAPLNVKLGCNGFFNLRSTSYVADGLSLHCVRSPSGYEVSGSGESDTYALMLPLAGWFQRGARSVQHHQPGDVAVIDGRAPVHTVLSPEIQFERIVISGTDMHRALSEALDAPAHQRLDFAPHVQLDSGMVATARALADVFKLGMQGEAPLRQAPLAVANLGQTMVALMLELLPHRYSALLARDIPAPAPRQVKRAMEFMHACASRPITLADVACAVGCSERALQAGFRRFRSISPMAYLRQIRLVNARAELLNPASMVTVAEVAYRWGFAHLGAFSAYYKKAYGELPSVTLRKRKV